MFGNLAKKIRGAAALLALLALAGCSGAVTQKSASVKPEAAVAVSDAPTDGSARRMRLVTAEQYRNTLAYVFGPNIAIPAAFAYNIFAARLNRFDSALEGFGSELIALMVRDGKI